MTKPTGPGRRIVSLQVRRRAAGETPHIPAMQTSSHRRQPRGPGGDDQVAPLKRVLVDGSVLITGEVDRTNDFEHGMRPAHQGWTGSKWAPAG